MSLKNNVLADFQGTKAPGQTFQKPLHLATPGPEASAQRACTGTRSNSGLTKQREGSGISHAHQSQTRLMGLPLYANQLGWFGGSMGRHLWQSH